MSMTAIQATGIRNYQKLYLILANISLILFFCSIWQVRPIIVDIDDFLGLTSHLNIVYWLGLSLITFCSVLIYTDKRPNNETIFLYILLVIGIFLFGLGTFAEENVRAWSSYYPPGEVKKILEDGYVDITSKYPLTSYRSWPAIHFISSFILLLTGVDIISLIKYMPLFWIVLFSLIIYTIGKKLTSSSNQSFIMSLLTISSFWQVYYYYSPQSYAYLSFLLLFMIMVTIKTTLMTRVLMVLLFIVMTITHLFYSLISFTALSVHSLRRKEYKFVFLMLAIFAGWQLYLASTAFDMATDRLITFIDDFELSILSQTDKYMLDTPIKAQVNSFRFAYLIIDIIFISLSLIIYRLGKIENDMREYIKTLFYWLIVIASFGIIKYGTESFERVYMFSIVFIIAIIVLSFSNLNKKIIIGLTILFICLHIPAHYGSDSFMATRTSELKGAEFFAFRTNLSSLENPPQGVTKGYYIYSSIGNRFISYHDPSLAVVKSVGGEYLDTHIINKTYYIIWGMHSRNRDLYYIGKDLVGDWIISNDDNVDVTKIYNNGGLDIYKHRVYWPEWVTD